MKKGVEEQENGLYAKSQHRPRGVFTMVEGRRQCTRESWEPQTAKHAQDEGWPMRKRGDDKRFKQSVREGVEEGVGGRWRPEAKKKKCRVNGYRKEVVAPFPAEGTPQWCT